MRVRADCRLALPALRRVRVARRATSERRLIPNPRSARVAEASRTTARRYEARSLTLADADKLRVIGLISSYTLSEARMAHDAARAAQHAATLTDGVEPAPNWTFESLLRELIDQPTYPRLHQIAWSEEIGDNPSGFAEHEEYQFGLDRILDGVQTLIDGSRP
jgi:hypothetical protein